MARNRNTWTPDQARAMQAKAAAGRAAARARRAAEQQAAQAAPPATPQPTRPPAPGPARTAYLAALRAAGRNPPWQHGPNASELLRTLEALATAEERRAAEVAAAAVVTSSSSTAPARSREEVAAEVARRLAERRGGGAPAAEVGPVSGGVSEPTAQVEGEHVEHPADVVEGAETEGEPPADTEGEG